MLYRLCTKTIPLILFIAFFQPLTRAQQDSIHQNPDSKISFKDPLDGAYDMSNFLLNHKGVLPMPVIVTEPAIGYGGGLGLLFFQRHKKQYGHPVPPNVTGIAGLATENKTWAAMLFHFHVFGDDRFRTYSVIGKPNLHIKYYGNNNEFLSKNPVSLHMDALLLVQRGVYRFGDSHWWAGLSYYYYRTENSVDTIPGKPLVNDIIKRLKGTSTISTLRPMFFYDNRDNIFTPTSGINAGLTYAYSANWLGADEAYSSLKTYFLGYQPISSRLFSAWRFEGNFLIGNAPLYAYPYIDLRGIPNMKYQSDNTLLAETEWRYSLYKRWSVLGFTGGGKAFNNLDAFKDVEWVYTFGTGFRYQIARLLGMHTGMDFAWGNGKDFALYIVFGTSW